MSSGKSEDEVIRIGLVGAGLAGTMLAALLEKLPGVHVTVFERRNENAEDTASAAFGNSQSAAKRSINLALSYRGIQALNELGLTEEVLQMAIRMPKRVIHAPNGSVTFQMYGKGDETLWSVGRQDLNKYLLRCISTSKTNRIEVRVGHTLLSADLDGTCRFRGANNEEYSAQFDLVIGADGAYSRVRDCMLRLGRVSFARKFIEHGYKEFTIPAVVDASGKSHFALADPEGIQIWPKKELMLIALPNPDKTFTATLFAPYKTVFDRIAPTNVAQVQEFFQRVFPETLPYLPYLLENYRENPVGSLLTLRVDPWKLGPFLVIGDAAHAVVPFYGQGMNAAFEDALQLYRALKQLPNSGNKATRLAAYHAAIEGFAVRRKQAVDVLSDLCLEHYHDMAANTANPVYLWMQKLQNLLLPSSVRNLYRYIAFSDVPYDEARDRAAQTETVFHAALVSAALSLAAGVGYFAYQAWGKGGRGN